MSSLDKITSILEEIDLIHSRLNESISPKEKREINDIINKKKNGDFIFNSIDVHVKSSSNDVVLSYSSDGKTDDLTLSLTDIADARGLEFKFTTSGKTNNFKILT
jgi:hypothetical protein